jgi:hypothetical protein
MRWLAAIAAACVVAMAVSCTSPARESAPPGSSETPPKPDFTTVTSSMFVDKSAVPNGPATEFTAPNIEDVTPGSNEPVDPPECAPVYWGPDSSQAGAVSWTTTGTPDTSSIKATRAFHLFLTVPVERPDFEALLGKCGTVTYQGATTTASLLRLPGVPSWATATRIVTQGVDGAGIIGLCRGLFVSVAFTQQPGGELSPDDANDLVKLFNDQVAKLEAI